MATSIYGWITTIIALLISTKTTATAPLPMSSLLPVLTQGETSTETASATMIMTAISHSTSRSVEGVERLSGKNRIEPIRTSAVSFLWMSQMTPAPMTHGDGDEASRGAIMTGMASLTFSSG